MSILAPMNGSTTIDTTFISLVTDFGFKRIFGSEKRKHLLIRFLNALLGDGITVTDVKFLQTEKLPEHMDGKRIIYDVSFLTPTSITMERNRHGWFRTGYGGDVWIHGHRRMA